MKKKHGIIGLIIAAVFMTMSIFTASALAQTVKWRLVSVWPFYSAIFQSNTRLAKSIYELSGGRLQISVHPAGELVSSVAVFDTVSKGSAEMGVDYPSYWAGNNSAFDLLGSYPMIFSVRDFVNWYYHGNGKDLINDLYMKYNMRWYLMGAVGAASGIRSRVPIRSLADLKGKKIRMVGKASGYILQKVGAVQVMTAPAEIAQAIVAGTVDGVSFSNLGIDWSMGLGEVTKYCIGPGWNQPFSASGVIINKGAWDSLPADLRKIIEVAIGENDNFMTSLAQWDQTDWPEKFKSKGVQNFKWSEKDMKQVEEWTWEYILEEAKKNPDYEKIVTSMFQWQKGYRETRDFEAPYSLGRNLYTFPKLPGLK